MKVFGNLLSYIDVYGKLSVQIVFVFAHLCFWEIRNEIVGEGVFIISKITKDQLRHFHLKNEHIWRNELIEKEIF